MPCKALVHMSQVTYREVVQFRMQDIGCRTASKLAVLSHQVWALRPTLFLIFVHCRCGPCVTPIIWSEKLALDFLPRYYQCSGV